MQVTWEPHWGGQPSVTVDGNPAPLILSQPVGNGAWRQNVYEFSFPFNPNHEVVGIAGLIDVGQVVIDTICIPEPSSLVLVVWGCRADYFPSAQVIFHPPTIRRSLHRLRLFVRSVAPGPSVNQAYGVQRWPAFSHQPMSRRSRVVVRPRTCVGRAVKEAEGLAHWSRVTPCKSFAPSKQNPAGPTAATHSKVTGLTSGTSINDPHPRA